MTTQPSSSIPDDLQPLSKLRNGYTVVAVAPVRRHRTNRWIVLAVMFWGPDESEYATWEAENAINTYDGDYSRDFSVAVESFKYRTLGVM